MFQIESPFKNANIPRPVYFTEPLFEQLNQIVQDNDVSFNLFYDAVSMY